MEGTRLRILQLLQRNGHDTVDGLATAIGLAPATIRRHLDILQRDRLVAFEEVRKKTGRPEYSFYLTENGQETLPKDYDLLLNMVMEELTVLNTSDTSGRDGDEILSLLFSRMSDKVWERYSEDVTGKDVGYRLDALVDLLKQEDFSPEVGVEDGTIRIKLLNCPFRSVALRNKAVCFFDLHLITSMLDTEPVLDSSIQNGEPGCVYSAHIGTGQAALLSPIAERIS